MIGRQTAGEKASGVSFSEDEQLKESSQKSIVVVARSYSFGGRGQEVRMVSRSARSPKRRKNCGVG
jgi:hypothetical protein